MFFKDDKNNVDNKDLKVAFSMQSEENTEGLLSKFSDTNHVISFVEKKKRLSSKGDLELMNPESSKTFRAVSALARRNKSDLIMVLDSKDKGILLGVRYQKRYKYLNPDQIAALFVNYICKTQSKQFTNKSFIASAFGSSSLPSKIAAKYGVKSSCFDDPIEATVNKTQEKMLDCLFSFSEDGRFAVKESGALVQSAASVAVLLADMASFYKESGINLYEQLKGIYKKFGIHRSVTYVKELSADNEKKLVKKFSKTKKIGDHKVDEVVLHEVEDGDSISMNFKDGSKISLRKHEHESKVKFFIENVGSVSQKSLDLVVFEKQVEEWIRDNTETFEDKKFSWKTVAKYAIFVSILGGILALVFTQIYHSANTGSSGGVFTVVQALFSRTNRWVWMTLWIWIAFTKFLSAWTQVRMFQRLKVKVNPFHLVVSSMMSSVIAFITPFAVGGDAIGYWYLRRKGVPRAALISVLASSTLWGETRYALQTMIFIMVGYRVYMDIFTLDSPESIATLIWFIVGMVWAWFAAFMIMILTLNKRIQEFITRNTVRFMEWFPLIHIYDPGKISAGTQYQFFLIRDGMKRIWSTWWFVLEIMFYTLLPMFLSPSSIIMAVNGSINKDLPLGPYWAQLITNDIIGTSNSLSITPGGSGTGEWLSVNIKNYVYKGSAIEAETGYTTKLLASGNDFFWKIFSFWPDYVLSIISIGLVLTIDNGKLGRKLSGRTKALVSTFVIGLFVTGIVLLYLLF